MKTAPAPQQLGEWLIAHQLCTADQLEEGLHEQRRAGGKLGQVLTSLKHLNLWQLYECLARQHQHMLVDLHTAPCDVSLLRFVHYPDYLKMQAIPWQRRGDALYVACTQIDAETSARLSAFFGETVTPVLCTPRDFRHAMETAFGTQIEHETRTEIMRTMPDYSAYRTTTSSQKRYVLALLATLAVLCALNPTVFLTVGLIAVNLFYLVTIGFKYLLYFRREHAPLPAADSPLPPLPDKDLPPYSILVPMYQEAESIPRLLDALRALDYPKHKLDIKLVLEADDDATYQAILAAKPESYFDIIRVPISYPRTKPRACNYALRFAKGDYVTIYDAEDAPAPDQLKKAVEAFRQTPKQVVCLQARLNYYNWSENLLSRFFAIEYSTLFDFMLPGLQRLGIPIPLGGTSNHINLKYLRALKNWDPYNVTEDADLGIRLAMCGYQTRTLDSVTLEEAPVRLIDWLKQRTRWIKGYMQTWLVYMRHPVVLYQQLGWRGFVGFQLFIGAPCLVFLLAPALWIFSALWFAGVVQQELTAPLMLLCYGVFMAGAFSQIHLALAAIRHWRWQGMRLYALLFPFYWFLHSAASLRALWQIVTRPHYWDKTPHAQTSLPQEPHDPVREFHA